VEESHIPSFHEVKGKQEKREDSHFILAAVRTWNLTKRKEIWKGRWLCSYSPPWEPQILLRFERVCRRWFVLTCEVADDPTFVYLMILYSIVSRLSITCWRQYTVSPMLVPTSPLRGEPLLHGRVAGYRVMVRRLLYPWWSNGVEIWC
jgi:hypothetical protein